MSKYKIVIYKEAEKNPDKNDIYRGFIDHTRDGLMIFNAPMDSDACIEILQHLHDLKSRKISDLNNN